jgi:hypothetical protein
MKKKRKSERLVIKCYRKGQLNRHLEQTLILCGRYINIKPKLDLSAEEERNITS